MISIPAIPHLPPVSASARVVADFGIFVTSRGRGTGPELRAQMELSGQPVHKYIHLHALASLAPRERRPQRSWVRSRARSFFFTLTGKIIGYRGTSKVTEPLSPFFLVSFFR